MQPDEYEVHLLQTARRGLDAVNEFFNAPAGIDPVALRNLHLKATVGSKVVASHTRYMSAINSRALLAAHFGAGGAVPLALPAGDGE